MQAQAPGSLPGQISDLSGDRAAIEQATGMVAAQAHVSISEAGSRLRVEATKQQRALADIAHAVVARTLRFD